MFPIFEVPDENIHYFTVQWIADNRALPYVPETVAEAEALGLEREWTGQEVGRLQKSKQTAVCVNQEQKKTKARPLINRVWFP